MTKGGGQTRISGQVIDYTGKELRLRLAGGQEQRVPSDRVLSVQTHYDPQQTAAREAFDRNDFEQALVLYRRALEAESRRWVRRQIVARLVWCYRGLGQWRSAGETFLLLVRDDPHALDFDCIPLAWVSSQPSAALEQAAAKWLAREDVPAAVLLGASHLMPTASGPRALDRLRRLAQSADPRIAQLALAQTWRAQVATADQQQIRQWQEVVQRMPEPLRAGPYVVLGRAWARRGQWEQAALAILRVPLVYPQYRQLAARSLLDAGHCLGQLDQPKQALQLYRELLETYPQSRAAEQVRGRLKEQTQPY